MRQSSGPRPPRDPLINLVKRVSTKLEEGDYKGAVRIACSDDTIADINDETLSALKLKHPPVHPNYVAAAGSASALNCSFRADARLLRRPPLFGNTKQRKLNLNSRSQEAASLCSVTPSKT